MQEKRSCVDSTLFQNGVPESKKGTQINLMLRVFLYLETFANKGDILELGCYQN